MNKNVCHRSTFIGNYTVMFLLITEDFLGTLTQLHPCTRVINKEPQVFHFLDSNIHKRYLYKKVYFIYTPRIHLDEHILVFQNLFEEIFKESIDKTPGYFFIVAGLILRFLYLLEDETMFKNKKFEKSIVNEEQLFIKITHLIENTNGQITREKLSQTLNYSGDYISRIIKKYTGLNLTKYKQLYSLHEAERLLVDTKMNISTIISLLGFSNRSYFYRIFESKNGIGPSEFRKRHRSSIEFT